MADRRPSLLGRGITSLLMSSAPRDARAALELPQAGYWEKLRVSALRSCAMSLTPGRVLSISIYLSASVRVHRRVCLGSPSLSPVLINVSVVST
ncbi:hypothetical protein BDW60DRAFT_178643 [Aspergillus nidulans var. acristatus]